MKKPWAAFIAFFLFMVLLGAGFFYSQVKSLWNDELYTQSKSIEKMSYGQILAGQVPEGNNSPLFYLLQKGLCDLTGYRLPFAWKGEWETGEPTGQIVLRVVPNICMALSLMAIFYFLSVKYSYWAGVYGLLIALSTSTVLVFWVEARPYALWFLLSIAQILLFWDAVEKKSVDWKLLGLCNFLLCFTIFFGIVQVLMVSALIFLLLERRWTRFVLPAGLPILVALFYFTRAAKYKFNLPVNWVALISDNVAVVNFFLLMVFCILFFSQKRPADRAKIGFWLLTAATFFLSIILLGLFGLMSGPDQPRFEIASRYFIFLAPIGIMAMPVMAVELVNMFRGNVWMLFNIFIMLAGILLLRLFQVVPLVSGILKY